MAAVRRRFPSARAAVEAFAAAIPDEPDDEFLDTFVVDERQGRPHPAAPVAPVHGLGPTRTETARASAHRLLGL